MDSSDDEDNKALILLLLIFPIGFVAWRVATRLNPCWSNYIFYCKETDQCIIKSQMCDRFQDCPNDLDEINCKCPKGEYSCAQGRCIEEIFLCDGVKDCPKGDDEMQPNCNVCADNEWFCYKENKCIPRIKFCDGVVDCFYGFQDEIDCVSTGGVISVTLNGMKYSLCADEWPLEWNHLLCLYTGQGLPTSNSKVRHANITNFAKGSWNQEHQYFSFSIVENCSGEVVFLACSENKCGKRKVKSDSINFYIINGVQVEAGAWPWFATLYYKGRFHCAGAIIEETWVITAAHCLLGSQTASNFMVGVGGMHLSGEPGYQLLAVSKLVSFTPDHANPTDDIALLKLVNPIKFTEKVQPICLPSGYVESFYKICVIVGHGTTLKDRTSNSLLQARIGVYDPIECEAIVHVFRNIRPYGRQVCLGSGTRKLSSSNICQGDSGGPVMCLDPMNMWVIIGVNSYVMGSRDLKRGSECQISFASRVAFYMSWIRNVTLSD